ncbi:hypothetical protein ABZ916_39335 [Streptomyces sp. NPDC046853]|uniref:hypothetical protein n=1 Tax=Streptomyces sp. NPDC046853 TaxID=3154920 RepID=UPI0034022D1C
MTDQLPRRFHLVRDVDETGTSGTGVVVEGLEFTDGTVALRWLTATTSTAIYASIADVETIHGHGGKTRVVWVDGQTEPHRQLIAQLRADRAIQLGIMQHAVDEEIREAASTLAYGCLHAIARTLRVFEGAAAAEAYLEQHADGGPLSRTTPDNPVASSDTTDNSGERQ